jgi:hypothetical protein
MELGRSFANVQVVRNVLVAELPENQLEHLAFPPDAKMRKGGESLTPPGAVASEDHAR